MSTDTKILFFRKTGLIILFLFLAAFVHLLTVPVSRDTLIGDLYRVSYEDHTGGGFAGGIIIWAFAYCLGTAGAYVLTICGLIVGAIVLTQKPLLTQLGAGSRNAAIDARNRRRMHREEKALELGGFAEDTQFTGINGGTTVTTGFSHSAVLGLADTVINAVKSGAIRHFFLVGGCDGAKPGRNYYTEFVKQTPSDTVILTLACGKYRFNDLDIGTIGGLPRIMDMGQCNDAYSAIRVAVALAEAFGCGVNDLPLSMILSWYEQKAVCILLTLLYLGIKNIRLGPSLPAFISPNVLNYLVENYNIAPISTPEEDLKTILG